MNKSSSWIAMVLLCAGCSWLHGRHPKPDQPELVVTGAPRGSLIVVDGVTVGESVAADDQSREIDVPAGDHIVEVRVSGAVVYREQTYVGPGQKRTVRVLSGFNRQQ